MAWINFRVTGPFWGHFTSNAELWCFPDSPDDKLKQPTEEPFCDAMTPMQSQNNDELM